VRAAASSGSSIKSYCLLHLSPGKKNMRAAPIKNAFEDDARRFDVEMPRMN